MEMSRLKIVFGKLGFGDVSTYINSGNIIFTSEITEKEKLVNIIETALKTEFGLALKCVIRESANIKLLAKSISPSWKNDTDQKTDVLFLWEHYNNKDSLKLIKNNPEVDNLVYLEGAIVWNIERKNYTKSGMHKFIGSEVYKNMTARNINTIRKLALIMD